MILQNGCEAIEIGFKSGFLIELVNSIPSEDISISMTDPSRAAVLSRCDEEELQPYLLINADVYK